MPQRPTSSRHFQSLVLETAPRGWSVDPRRDGDSWTGYVTTFHGHYVGTVTVLDGSDEPMWEWADWGQAA